MICEYALDPRDAFSRDGFWSQLKDFGVAQGRVIVECPKRGWRKDMEQALCQARNELGDVAFSRLVERWKQLLDHRGIIKRDTCDADCTKATWVDQVRAEHDRCDFHAILTNHKCAVDVPVLTKQDIDLGDKRWMPDNQRIVAREPRAIARCAGPLGILSTELLYIDPYFDDHKKWTVSLLEILSACNSSNGHFKRIEVHTSEYKRTEHGKSSKAMILRRELAKSLPKRLPVNNSVTFLIWKERDGGDRYHRRYVLTERGGVFFEGGLDKGTEGQTTDVGLLSDAVWEQRWSEYQRETAVFDLVDSFVFTGTRNPLRNNRPSAR